MVKAQEWLEENYPNKEQKITKLDVKDKSLEGSLKLEEFTNLKKFSCQRNLLTRLEITNCPNLKEIDCKKNELTELKLDQLEELTSLDCGNNNLTELIFDKLGKFIELNCHNNHLIKLNVSNCSDLTKLRCEANLLADLNLSQNTKLEALWISSNNFAERDLSFLSHLINLRELGIGNWDKEKINQGIYNHFYGSLKLLKSLTKLEILDIHNTDLSSGLEYLPDSVRKISCSARLRKDAKVKAIDSLFANEQGKVERDRRGYIKNFFQKFQAYKKRKKSSSPQKSAPSPTKRPRIEVLAEDQLLAGSVQTKLSKKPVQVKPTLNYLLGKGGYGEVYYGKWKLQDVAVKKLYLSIPNVSESDLKDIRKEIDILKNLRNRYIIQYYDTYSDSQEILIIMDYAENGTLTKFINDHVDKDHDWNLNTNLIKQIALGLAYIHQQGIIHRDLKSMNILMVAGNQAKISDFGLSRTKIVSSSQSKHGITGTLRWMAPELLKGEKYSEQSDIYALGMVIWEIAAKCTVPFKDVDNNLIYVYIISGKKETIPSATPWNIKDIIEGCWKDNPQERISLVNALEIIEDDKISSPTNNEDLPRSQNNKTINDVVLNSAAHSLSLGLIDSTTAENTEQESGKNAKRQLSLESKTRQQKMIAKQDYQSEKMELKSSQNWTNLHPNFTPQLIQAWQNHNFTYEQARDWINIHSPVNQVQAIQEPEYHAWLRDIKQVDSDWVLNHGNHQSLKQEYQTYQQQNQEQQAQILHNPPK